MIFSGHPVGDRNTNFERTDTGTEQKPREPSQRLDGQSQVH